MSRFFDKLQEIKQRDLQVIMKTKLIKWMNTSTNFQVTFKTLERANSDGKI